MVKVRGGAGEDGPVTLVLVSSVCKYTWGPGGRDGMTGIGMLGMQSLFLFLEDSILFFSSIFVKDLIKMDLTWTVI